MKASHNGPAMAGNRGGTLMKLLVFIVVFCCVIAAAWIYFLPIVLTSALQKHTGFPVKVTQLGFNPFTAKVDLTGLVISNPPGFPRPHFIEVTSFSANAQMKTLFSDRPVFDYARLEVAYVALVRDSDGVLNAELFNARLNPPPKPEKTDDETPKKDADDSASAQRSPAQAGPAKPKPDATKTPTTLPKPAEPVAKNKNAKDAKAAAPVKPVEKPIRFTINRLELALDKVIVADFAQPKPDIREYNCKLYYTFNNFSDPKQLLAPFAMKSLQSVGAAIQGLIPGDIGKAFASAVKPTDPMLKPKEEKEAAEDPLKTVVEKLEETQKP